MTVTTKRPFRWRGFWSLLLVVTTVGLAWSGIQNHELELDGFTTARHAWMSAHSALALLFVVAETAHVVLNGKALLRHAHGLAAPLPSREAMAALAVTAGLLLLAAGHAGIAGARGGPEHGAGRSDHANR